MKIYRLYKDSSGRYITENYGHDLGVDWKRWPYPIPTNWKEYVQHYTDKYTITLEQRLRTLFNDTFDFSVTSEVSFFDEYNEDSLYPSVQIGIQISIQGMPLIKFSFGGIVIWGSSDKLGGDVVWGSRTRQLEQPKWETSSDQLDKLFNEIENHVWQNEHDIYHKTNIQKWTFGLYDVLADVIQKFRGNFSGMMKGLSNGIGRDYDANAEATKSGEGITDQTRRRWDRQYVSRNY